MDKADLARGNFVDSRKENRPEVLDSELSTLQGLVPVSKSDFFTNVHQCEQDPVQEIKVIKKCQRVGDAVLNARSLETLSAVGVSSLPSAKRADPSNNLIGTMDALDLHLAKRTAIANSLHNDRSKGFSAPRKPVLHNPSSSVPQHVSVSASHAETLERLRIIETARSQQAASDLDILLSKRAAQAASVETSRKLHGVCARKNNFNTTASKSLSKLNGPEVSGTHKRKQPSQLELDTADAEKREAASKALKALIERRNEISAFARKPHGITITAVGPSGSEVLLSIAPPEESLPAKFPKPKQT